MNKWGKVLLVSFTYMGTIVGAGFATGQEILQFFTQYGRTGTFTIVFAVLLFSWLGMKIMLISHDQGATSYEDLNKFIFGERIGRWFSLVTLIMLFGVTTVMLAGAGSIFVEQLQMSYQAGLIITLLLSYGVIMRGMNGILTANSVVVPIMLLVTVLITLHTTGTPGAENWIRLHHDAPTAKAWTAPILYAAYNLSLAQAVLVPLGSNIQDRNVLKWGGLAGGAGIGLLLLAGHFALTAHMPGVAQFEIPMGHIISNLGAEVRLLFLLAVYGEIFTTFIADVYGLSLQICQRTGLKRKTVSVSVMALCFIISQFGFSKLLSTLYPLFGLISLAWFTAIIWREYGTRPNGG